MDTQRINRLADFLDSLPEGHHFTLTKWYEQTSDCGTVACIAGYAAALYAEQANITKLYPAAPCTNDCRYPSYSEVAQDILALDTRQAHRLFMPFNEPGQSVDGLIWGAVRPEQAAAVLRNLARTGEVDWPSVLLSEQPTPASD